MKSFMKTEQGQAWLDILDDIRVGKPGNAYEILRVVDLAQVDNEEDRHYLQLLVNLIKVEEVLKHEETKRILEL